MNKIDDKEYDYEDYFFTKYGADITDLFLSLRNISDGFCVNIFNSSYQIKNGSYDLSTFLFDKIILLDEIKDNDDNEIKEKHELEEENIIFNNI